MGRLAVILFVTALVVGTAGAAPSAVPPAPTNVEVIGKTPTSITLAWGPSMPGEFYATGEGKNYVMVAWGISQDARGPVTYTLSKDGQTLATGITTNTYRVQVPPGRREKGFRTCVTAQLADGRSSPPQCATWTQ